MEWGDYIAGKPDKRSYLVWRKAIATFCVCQCKAIHADLSEVSRQASAKGQQLKWRRNVPRQLSGVRAVLLPHPALGGWDRSSQARWCCRSAKLTATSQRGAVRKEPSSIPWHCYRADLSSRATALLGVRSLTYHRCNHSNPGRARARSRCQALPERTRP